jgi:putative endonuclease
MFFVYILQSVRGGRFYIGHTENLDQRLREHFEGRSLYTKSRGPWELVFAETYLSRSEAMKREREIKRRKSKKHIERLIADDAGGWKTKVARQGSVG